MKKMLFFLALIAPLFLMGMTVSSAQGRWEFLGQRAVNFGLDHDVIPVTWREGSFNAIRIDVRRGALNMHRCIVFFENGGRQEIELRHNFGRGSDSRIIDLVGNNRLIERIEFWYDTKNFARMRADVLVFGRH